MNGSPMGTMSGWINTEADLRHQGKRPGRGMSMMDRIFGRNHELARNSEQTLRFLVAARDNA